MNGSPNPSMMHQQYGGFAQLPLQRGTLPLLMDPRQAFVHMLEHYPEGGVELLASTICEFVNMKQGQHLLGLRASVILFWLLT